MENTGGEDVLMQILVCLPVTSLLRFKSVCKPWRELIQSSFFIDLHTTATTSSSSNKFGTFILQATIECSYDLYSWEKENNEIKMFMLSSGSGDGDGTNSTGDEDDHKMVFKVDDLGFSPVYKDFQLTDTISVVGSCNGLICLHDSKRRDAYLWNPATRQFRILPKSIPIEKELGGVERLEPKDFVAFGFDVKTMDYKVVWITCFLAPWEEEECMCRVEVYSLSTDSWRLLEGINSLPGVQLYGPGIYINGCHGIYMNGSYFFVGSKTNAVWSFPEGSNNFLMLSFDFTKEIFTTMQFPDHDVRHRMVLSNLGDKMVVVMIRNNNHVNGYEYEIWVLNDHSSCVNKESWTKLHSYQIKNNGAVSSIRHEPIYISNKGEFALISTIACDGRWSSKLKLFNLVTKEAQKAFTIGDGACRGYVYKQSLVSIIGRNGGAAASRYHHRGAM